MRYGSLAGIRPRLPRLRLAALGGASASHMTRRVAQTVDFGMHHMLSPPVTLPLTRLVDGERGARLLVTNLVNRTQPLIRLELLTR